MCNLQNFVTRQGLDKLLFTIHDTKNKNKSVTYTGLIDLYTVQKLQTEPTFLDIDDTLVL